MTQIVSAPAGTTAGPDPHDASRVDLSAVAAESPAESIAHENEIVEQIALEQDTPGQPIDPAITEQLHALVDPDAIRHS